MHVIILKYVQVLCITVFFSNNVNCDKLLLHNNQEDQHLYRIGSCAAQCMAKQNASTEQSLESCYKLCSEGTAEQESTLVQGSDLDFNINLICRDSTSMVIGIEQPQDGTVEGKPNSRVLQRDPKTRPHTAINRLADIPIRRWTQEDAERFSTKVRRSISNSKGQLNNRNDSDVSHKGAKHYIYLIKVQESGTDLGDRIVYMSNASIIRVEDLAPNKQYNITATVLSSSGEYFYVDSKQQFKTLPMAYTPGSVTELKISDFNTSRRNSSLLEAVVSWKPAVDKTCAVRLVFFFGLDYKLHEIDLRKPEERNRFTLTTLELNKEFAVGIMTKNTQYFDLESDTVWTKFYTPDCAEWYNKSQVMCAPEDIVGLRVKPKNLSGDRFRFNISWRKPEVLPEYYILTLFDLSPERAHLSDDEAHSVLQKLDGDKTSFVIDSVPITGPEVQIHLEAHANNRTTVQYSLLTLRRRRNPAKSKTGEKRD